MIERSLDLLSDCKGKVVDIELRDKKKPVRAVLLTFDIHINIVIQTPEENKVFIRGNNIISIQEAFKNGAG